MDVLVEQADEDQLTIHFWDGRAWRALDTVRSPYYNMVSAPSQGSGVYALLAGVTTPHVAAIQPATATNAVTTTLVIRGRDFVPPVEVALMGPTTTYTLPVKNASSVSITAVVTRGLPAHEYRVRVSNRFDAPAPETLAFALYPPPPPHACFYDFFGSGASQWQSSGTWSIVGLPDGNQAMTDSPAGNYDSAASPAVTMTTGITTVAFNLSGCPRPALTFRHDYVIDNRPPSQDRGRVEISSDGGATWKELAAYSGGIYSSLSALGASNEWAAARWKNVEIDLNGYTGRVQLRFSLQVDRYGADKGWLIDDVLVRSRSPGYRILLPLVLRSQ
jgi:hypothetical protein